mgnify:CR=1 FL=1
MINKRRAPLRNKQIKIKTPVLGVETNRTHRYRNRTKRVRKQAKVRSALLSLHKLVERIHEDDEAKMCQTTEKFLAHHANINIMDGEHNDTHPLAFAAGGLGPNPNILSHGEAMAVVDKENSEESMSEEMEKCFDNNIYEIVKRSSVPELKSILRAV